MDFVTVAIRIKPCQNPNGKSVELLSTDPPVIVVPERQISFSFDNIYSENATQEGVYNEMVQPLVRNIINGYNSTIFAYGQTGTGKTYTIGSDPAYYHNNEAGLITRALNDIMSWQGDQMITTYISFVEIYNEKVYDLLGNNKTALQIKGFNVTGAKKQQVLTLLDAQLLLIEGGKNRHTGETRQNSKSSRSHAIFTIYCNVKDLLNGQETEAKLNLVDLAGSESVKKTGNEGSQLHEGININKGLLCVGQVINALSNNHSYVPYRQSTITTILQDSLNKKNFVTLVACIGTNIEDLTETVQTLDFSQRAKRVKNKPEVNSIVGEYSKLYNSHATRNTPYKLSLNTPNKYTQRTPLNPHSHNINRKRPLIKSTSTTSLSTTEASIPSYSSMSMVPELPDSLSPIVKKCIEAVGEKFLTRVTNIVTDLMTPAVSRTNSPRISRRSLVREVTEIVQSHMSAHSPTGEFRTFRNEIDSIGDTSACCVDHYDAREKENHASYGYIAQMFDEGPASSFIVSGNKTPSFKKPFAPIGNSRKRGRPKKSIAASSPIQKPHSPVKITRRSVRISQRLSTMHDSLRCMCCLSPKVKVRRSKRISMIKTPDAPKPSPKKRAKIEIVSNNYSTTKKRSSLDNNLKDHAKQALVKLNSGNVKEIMTFNTIGAKYAAMICQFRQIKGSFHKISDLSVMPWRGQGYKNFLKSNFLEA